MMWTKILALLSCVAFSQQLDNYDNVAFVKLGSFSEFIIQNNNLIVKCWNFTNFLTEISNYHVKNYYIPRYFKTSWTNSRSLCQSFGMDFVSLETENEANEFLNICKSKANLFQTGAFIGAISLEGASRSQWYWLNSGNRITYPIPFGPGKPNNVEGRAFCLELWKYSASNFLFVDAFCSGYESQFICQETSYAQ